MIKTHSVCDIVRIPVSNVLKVLPMIKEEALLSGLVDPAPKFVSKLLEKVARMKIFSMAAMLTADT